MRKNKFNLFVVILVCIILLLSPTLNIILSKKSNREINNLSVYSQDTDTIYVKNSNNSLKSISKEVGNSSLFTYYGSNNSAVCRTNLTIEGELKILNETLFIKSRKRIIINGTGKLSIITSQIKVIKKELRWWEKPNRYSITKYSKGSLKINESKISSIGWSDNTGERGIEIFDNNFSIANTKISKGYIGLIFSNTNSSDNFLGNVTVKNMDSVGVLSKSGKNQITFKNSTFKDNSGYDIEMCSDGNFTILNTSYESKTVTGDGNIIISYYQDFIIRNESGLVEDELIEIESFNKKYFKTYKTDAAGKVSNIRLPWLVNTSSISKKYQYTMTTQNSTTYFSPSNYNLIETNISIKGEVCIWNVSVEPSSFVPINNELEPNNLTINVELHNKRSEVYYGNISFYYVDKKIFTNYISISPNTTKLIGFNWTPRVDGYSKIKAKMDGMEGKTSGNLKAWSDVVFAGFYNTTIQPHRNKTEKIIEMMKHSVENEDGEKHYTIYEDWSIPVLSEIGLNYYAAYEITGNHSYYKRGKEQLEYILGFRDRWGLFNRSTVNKVRGRYDETYYEWSTHWNIRSALALQQAYLFTNNETYLNFTDNVIEFILNKVAMTNITFHDGVKYKLPWESTKPNNGTGRGKGISKNFSFTFVNGYVQLGRLFTQAYYDKNLNSSYLNDDRLLPYINTCISYILNDQIKNGTSKGSWEYFSYYDEPRNKTRLPMHYAALTAMELTNINTYLQWKNISQAIENYTNYIKDHMTLRSAIDVNNGGQASIETYVFVRSLFNTTSRNVTKIDDFLFSNIFINENNTFNWFDIDGNIKHVDPKKYGFLYNHYNPIRTFLWDDYMKERKNYTTTVNLTSNGLSKGWNFVSLNIFPNDKNIKDILNDKEYGINGSYDKIFYYRNGDWLSYSSERDSRFNDNFSYHPSMGFWIHMIKNDKLEVKGIKTYDTSIKLKPGWNMVGYPSNNFGNNELPSNITKIGYFNSTKKYNLEYDNNTSEIDFRSGEGYWLFNALNKTISWNVKN